MSERETLRSFTQARRGGREGAARAGDGGKRGAAAPRQPGGAGATNAMPPRKRPREPCQQGYRISKRAGDTLEQTQRGTKETH